MTGAETGRWEGDVRNPLGHNGGKPKDARRERGLDTNGKAGDTAVSPDARTSTSHYQEDQIPGMKREGGTCGVMEGRPCFN